MQTHYAIKKETNKILKIKTADYTLKTDTEDMWATFSNSGASGEVSFTLPSAEVGMGYRFNVEAAQSLTLVPASGESIADDAGDQGSADEELIADAVGESVEIECKVVGTWDANEFIGTWTSTAP